MAVLTCTSLSAQLALKTSAVVRRDYNKVSSMTLALCSRFAEGAQSSLQCLLPHPLARQHSYIVIHMICAAEAADSATSTQMSMLRLSMAHP